MLLNKDALALLYLLSLTKQCCVRLTGVISQITRTTTEPSGRVILYTNIDQTLVNSLHGLLNCEIGGLD